jgi:8-oxo-dGTP pyrophosphatase MutT (NUDIX family)
VSAKFRRVSREVLVANPWHSYCKDRYVRTDGSVGDYFYVHMPGSCGVVPLFADGSTMLVRVERYVLGTTLWEFPIGGMKEGEDPLAVAAHELEEEAGLVAGKWTKLGAFAPYKGVSDEVCHFFLAEDLLVTGQRLETTENITAHRMPFAEARQKLLAQELLDGQSLVGLMLYERLVGR